MNRSEQLDVLDAHLTHTLKLAAAGDWFAARHEARKAERLIQEKCEAEAEQMTPEERKRSDG